MEARATINRASVSKTFVAAVLVLVAMGLGAMGGYFAKDLGTNGASPAGVQQVQVHPAPGTVLRQDNPAQATEPNRIQKDDVLTANSAPIRASRGGHGQLP